MKNGIVGIAVLGLVFGLACGSSQDATDADVLAPDVPVDVPGQETADPDEGRDVPATDEGTVTDVPTDPGTPDAAFEWDASATPNCVDGFCAADKDHAPDPSTWGPFPVGLRRVVLIDPARTNADGTPRKLVTEIWYPTTKEYYDSHDKFAYDVRADAALLPEYSQVAEKIGTVDVGTFPVKAVQDAPVRHGDGRFPLVMFSHGAYGIRYQSIFYTVQLASHGFVVVAPDHEKNSLYDLLINGYTSNGLADSAMARPLDIQFLMDVMAQWDADPTNDFYKSIEADNVGVTGHSFGGYTSFAVAQPMDPEGFPEPDPRVKAIVPQAPAGYLIGVLGIGPDFHLPTMIQGGEMDTTLEFEQAFKQPYEQIGAPKWFLDIKRGGHFTFSDLCRLNLLEVADKLGWDDAKKALSDGCGVENWDWEEAQEAINLYSIAMFNRFLRGSTGSAQYMTAAAGERFGAEIEFLSQEQ